MKVSVLCPFKNEAKFILDCIESIQKQHLTSWELLLIDDHSSDYSQEIIKNIQKNDSRIQFFQNDGEGIIDALKTGYKKATGNFITRMDADDIMHPEKLQVMHDQLVTNGRGFIATSLVKYFSEEGLKEGYKKYEKWLNRLTHKGTNFDDIYKECVIPSPSWMMYKEDLDRIGAFEDLAYPEDYHLVFKMYEAGLKVIPSNKVLHYWRDHPNRASRNDPNYQDNTFLPLKVNYFLKLDYNPKQILVLWGAGSKGKKVARLLLEQNITFNWICDNPKKWGKEIYGVPMQSPEGITTQNHVQVIVAVAGAGDQQEIKNALESLALAIPYFFC